MHIRNFTIPVLALLGCAQLSGQELRKEVCVGFRVGVGTLDTTYAENAVRLSEIVSFLETIQKDKTLDLLEVTFCGSASPEGSFSTNRRLAEERCRNLEDYVRKYVSLPDSIVSRCENVIAWDALAHLAEGSDMPHKEEAVNVLRNVPEFTYDSRGVLIDSRKKHLMELQYGRTWHYMADHFFPQVRHASVMLVTARHRQEALIEPVHKPEIIARETASACAVPTVAEQKAAALQPEEKKPFYMALKTNMLYDAALIPNIGVEFHLKNNWSISAGWMYGWWKKDRIHWYWRAYGGDIAVRKWLGKAAQEKPLTGHHLGVYGQVLTYDFETGGRGYMGGEPGGTLFDRANFAGGVEYGYSLPVGRRLNLDFTIGVGYMGGKYYEYKPIDDCYVWQATKQRHYFGPTKLEVSLVWLLGRDNTNKGKGGKR